jgi:hypothetical protein
MGSCVLSKVLGAGGKICTTGRRPVNFGWGLVYEWERCLDATQKSAGCLLDMTGPACVPRRFRFPAMNAISGYAGTGSFDARRVVQDAGPADRRTTGRRPVNFGWGLVYEWERCLDATQKSAGWRNPVAIGVVE